MNINRLGIALIAYLTGGVLVYAYLNRNRYLDLLLATIALFVFGTSALLGAFGILPALSISLTQLAIFITVIAVILLFVRIGAWAYRALKRFWSGR